ncbi:DUF1349 domain-containing protein [Paenibacillus doosanensis]|uniref:DUF1349 domain-containing protein n=1 Tax=Paenibacillus doosanensis TaxID=1229154 RepID=UPI0021806BC1|nr:DUF1349 domain-containing protein [Paenibacillus doosanensis]MCS7460391.1 DUF1349 domain-containing protein [Paenibacillus doosanensis]
MLTENAIHTRIDSFLQLLRKEWTKFRKARGLVAGILIALLLTVLPGLFLSTMMKNQGETIPIGPNGEAVSDKFYFVHKPLIGDGSITVRVTSLTGVITYPPPNHDEYMVYGVVPWAKAGILIKDGLKHGSPYAAMMVTGKQGVRMQYNFIHDTAGVPGNVSPESPRWLRLTRSGDVITGYESMDGTQWTKVDTAHLIGFSSTAEIGLFVTSPGNVTLDDGANRFASATAVIDHVIVQGDGLSSTWSNDDFGAEKGLGNPILYGSSNESDGSFTINGNGDIAPLGAVDGWPVERSLMGTFAGLIAVMIVAVLFLTTENARLGLARALAAKACVIGIVSFVIGLLAAIAAVVICKQILLSNGSRVLPVSLLTEVRIILGTALLFAFAAIFAFTLAVLFRKRVWAVTISITGVALPYIIANLLPTRLGDVAKSLLQLTPAAGFSILQSIPQYPQVIGPYIPQFGYYPLAPWAGLSVLCGYTVLAVGLTAFYFRRKEDII